MIGIADGLNESIDWIVGRAGDQSGAEFSREDYAVFCQSAVLQVLLRTLDAVRNNPKTAIDVEAGLTLGHEPHEVAAIAMLVFIAIAELQAGHPSRPEDCFKRNFAALSDMAARRGQVISVRDLEERKP